MASDHPRQVLIAGAGIAGLTAALAFARRGIKVQLFEQAPQIDAIGAGIQLSPNATHILDRLGVLERLLPFAVEPRAVVLKDASRLTTLATIPLGEMGRRRWRAPYLVAHRGDVQKALLDTVGETPEIDLFTDAHVETVGVDSQGVVATFSGGAANVQERGDLLVGADGVWSTVRQSVSHARSDFTGNLAWRTTFTADGPAGSAFAHAADPACVTAFLHSGFHLVAYPMRGGREFNLVAFTKGEKIAKGWAGQVDISILRNALKGMGPSISGLADVPGGWKTWPVYAVDPQPAWTSSGAIALIGDAAHAMPPFAAQGAAMAIEDAAVLASRVAASAGSLSQALAAWESERKARVASVARRGSLNQLAWHAAGPVALARNLLLALRPGDKLAADLDWLYGWRAPD